MSSSTRAGKQDASDTATTYELYDFNKVIKVIVRHEFSCLDLILPPSLHCSPCSRFLDTKKCVELHENNPENWPECRDLRITSSKSKIYQCHKPWVLKRGVTPPAIIRVAYEYNNFISQKRVVSQRVELPAVPAPTPMYPAGLPAGLPTLLPHPSGPGAAARRGATLSTVAMAGGPLLLPSARTSIAAKAKTPLASENKWTRSCKGWSGSRERRVVQASIADVLRSSDSTDLPTSFPLSPFFQGRAGYNDLIITGEKLQKSVGVRYVLRSRECLRKVGSDQKAQTSLCLRCQDSLSAVSQLCHTRATSAATPGAIKASERTFALADPAEIVTKFSELRATLRTQLRNAKKREDLLRAQVDKYRAEVEEFHYPSENKRRRL